jgi:hypothetical protein
VSRDPFRHDPVLPVWDAVSAADTPHDCFADEIAIDFPSVGDLVERVRDAFLGEREGADTLTTEVSLSTGEAFRGTIVPLDVPLRGTCRNCGGRGETWTEPCGACLGTGDSVVHHPVRVSVPARVADGTRFRFRVSSPHAAPVRVELRVAIRSSAA